MIEWKEIQPDYLIHGLLDGVVVIRMKREGVPSFLWEMTGLVEGRSHYRNDLKEMAEVKLKLQEKNG